AISSLVRNVSPRAGPEGASVRLRCATDAFTGGGAVSTGTLIGGNSTAPTASAIMPATSLLRTFHCLWRLLPAWLAHHAAFREIQPEGNVIMARAVLGRLAAEPHAPLPRLRFQPVPF